MTPAADTRHCLNSSVDRKSECLSVGGISARSAINLFIKLKKGKIHVAASGTRAASSAKIVAKVWTAPTST